MLRGGLGGVHSCNWQETHRRPVGGRGQGLRRLELVKFWLSNAAASSRIGNVCKVMLVETGKGAQLRPD